MKNVFVSILALSLGSAFPAFAAGGATPGVASPAAHSTPKPKRASTAKQHKSRLEGYKEVAK